MPPFRNEADCVKLSAQLTSSGPRRDQRMRGGGKLRCQNPTTAKDDELSSKGKMCKKVGGGGQGLDPKCIFSVEFCRKKIENTYRQSIFSCCYKQYRITSLKRFISRRVMVFRTSSNWHREALYFD